MDALWYQAYGWVRTQEFDQTWPIYKIAVAGYLAGYAAATDAQDVGKDVGSEALIETAAAAIYVCLRDEDRAPKYPWPYIVEHSPTAADRYRKMARAGLLAAKASDGERVGTDVGSAPSAEETASANKDLLAKTIG